MATVQFTSALKRFFPKLDTQEMDVQSVAELLQQLEKSFPGLSDYLIDESGHLRKHVNIFVGDKMIIDRQNLTDQIQQRDEVLIFQALSGG